MERTAILPERPWVNGAADTAPFRYAEEPEDFVVVELPREGPDEQPSGAGDFAWVEIEKRGIDTPTAVRLLGDALRLDASAIRHAGMKDAVAVTRQRLSLPWEAAGALETLELGALRVLGIERSNAPLRLGQLRGNRFELRLRGLDEAGFAAVERGLARLAELGLPNAFGPQRYGARGDTAEIGRALLEGRPADATALIAGRAGERDFGPVLDARRAFDEGDFQRAAALFPRGYSTAARLARAMHTNRGRPANALRALSRRELGFYVSALQSQLFDGIVAARLPRLGALLEGDLALRHDPPATFYVDDLAAEQPRADALELSPSGPLFGRKLRRARGAAAALEARVAAELDLAPELFSAPGPLRAKGARRALRLPLGPARLRPLESDERGPHSLLELELPPGTYATAVLAELHRGPLPARSESPPSPHENR